MNITEGHRTVHIKVLRNDYICLKVHQTVVMLFLYILPTKVIYWFFVIIIKNLDSNW